MYIHISSTDSKIFGKNLAKSKLYTSTTKRAVCDQSVCIVSQLTKKCQPHVVISTEKNVFCLAGTVLA